MRWYEPILRDIGLYGLVLLIAVGVPSAVVYFTSAFVEGQEALVFFGVCFLTGFVCAAVVYWRLTRDPLAVGERETEEKLGRRLQSGELMGAERSVAFEDIDRAKICQLKLFSVWLLPIGLGIVLLMIFLIAEATLSKPYPLVISVTAFFIFAFLAYRYFLLVDRLLSQGEKSVIEGIVTRRFKRRYGRSRYYCLMIGSIEVRVFRHHYLSCRAGDRATVEVLRAFGDWNLRFEKSGGQIQE
jgi:hypothetical protein